MDIVLNTISIFQKRFESFLDHQNEDEVHRTQGEFEVQTDPAFIRGIPVCLPDDHIDRAIVVFHRLAPFFNAGILLQNEDGQWISKATFQNGKSKPLPQGKERSIKLPSITTQQIFSSGAQSLSGRLEIEFKNLSKESKALLLKPTADFSFILISELPKVWLDQHSEFIHTAVNESFLV